MPAGAALVAPSGSDPTNAQSYQTGGYTGSGSTLGGTYGSPTHQGSPQGTPPTPAYPTGSAASYGSQSGSAVAAVAGVPEPGTALFGLGLLAALTVRRRR
jgi:MYXO-CTERM domain-containing protein